VRIREELPEGAARARRGAVASQLAWAAAAQAADPSASASEPVVAVAVRLARREAGECGWSLGGAVEAAEAPQLVTEAAPSRP